MTRRTTWLEWEEPPGGGIFTRDHKDPSFAYFDFKGAIMEISELLYSIHLPWNYLFNPSEPEFVDFVGSSLTGLGKIERNSSKSEIYEAFASVSPDRTERILNRQVLTSVVSAYTRYLKTTLSFILPAHVDQYPKKFKIDLSTAASAESLHNLIVSSVIPEINALGLSDYPSLRRRCTDLGIFPKKESNDLLMVERYIRERNEFLHFHPGSELINTGKMRRSEKFSRRRMWSSIHAFTRVVSTIERKAMKDFKVWTGTRMLLAYQERLL